MKELNITQKLVNKLILHNPYDRIKARNITGLQIRRNKNTSVYYYDRTINNVGLKKTIGDIKTIELSSLNGLIHEMINEMHRQKHMSFIKICDNYLENVTPLYSKTYRLNTYGVVNKHIKDYFKDYDINNITKADVIEWVSQFTQSTQSNNITILSSIIKYAQNMGLHIQLNPCKGLTKRSNRVVRYLTTKEFTRLSKSIKRVPKNSKPNQIGVNLLYVKIVKLLLFTGARQSEILSLKWEYIRGDKIFLPNSKSGARIIYLSTQAVKIIQTCKGNNSEYVFPYKDKHITNNALKFFFNTLKKDANISTFRLHDLRHTFASVGVQKNISLLSVSKLLGHQDLETTTIYAHLNKAVVNKATQKISTKIFKSLTKGDQNAK